MIKKEKKTAVEVKNMQKLTSFLPNNALGNLKIYFQWSLQNYF